MVAGDGLEVVGAVEVGGAVDVGCACAFEVFEVGLFADVLGAFKHHVLEEVSEAGAAGALVERADVVPKVDGYEGEAMVFVSEDDETVGQGELFVLELGDFEGLCGGEGVGGVCDGGEGEAGEKSGDFQAFDWCHSFSPRGLAKACKVRTLGPKSDGRMIPRVGRNRASGGICILSSCVNLYCCSRWLWPVFR